MSLLFFTCVVTIIIYFGLLFYLYLRQDRMIFVTQPLITEPILDSETSEICLIHQGEQLRGWLIAHTNRPLLIYYGGNAEEVSTYLPILQEQETYAVLLVNYRGYGQSSGKPSENKLVDDALFILDHMHETHHVAWHDMFLMGRSLGSGVAVQVAAKRHVAGVILVTPYDCLVAVAARQYPWFPVKYVLSHHFDSLVLAPSIHVPAFFIIAKRDALIPPDHAFRLQSVWAGETQHYIFEEAYHHDIGQQAQFWPMIERYIVAHQHQKRV